MKDALARIDQLEADIADLRNQYEGLWKRLDDLTAPEVRNGKAKAESLEEVRLYCLKSGLTDLDAEWFWNKMEAIGWKVGGHPLKDWRRCVNTWKLARYGFPSLKSSVNGNQTQFRT